MKVGIGARVSTKDKDQNPENQLMPCREYCKRKGWDYKEYVEFVSGGKKIAKRLALSEMMEDLRKGEIEGVVWNRLDRFTREPMVYYPLVEEIVKLDKFCEFASGGERLDKHTPPQMVFSTDVQLAASRYERLILGLRVKEAIARKRKEAEDAKKPFHWGHKPLVFRSKVTGEVHTLDLEGVAGLRREGITLAELARQLGCSKRFLGKLKSEGRIP
jgi:DNA invertase Pin-like site-specific DNA recombinase